MRIAVITIAALAAFAGVAHSAGWSASQHEEDWGPFCTVTHAHVLGMTLGFHGAPGGYVAALLDFRQESYPDEVTSVWQVDDGKAYRLNGGLNDYFGYLELEVHDLGLLDAVASGRKLTVSLDGVGQINVPLDGSGAAIRSFRKCLSG